MPQPLLRNRDQLVTATLTAGALVSLACWWVIKGGATGGLVNIERAAPLDQSFLVDLNTAEWPELAQLPGIGEVLARRIVEYRINDGPYKKPQDLTKVRGIGPKTLERVRSYLLPLPGEEFVAGDEGPRAPPDT